MCVMLRGSPKIHEFFRELNFVITQNFRGRKKGRKRRERNTGRQTWSSCQTIVIPQVKSMCTIHRKVERVWFFVPFLDLSERQLSDVIISHIFCYGNNNFHHARGSSDALATSLKKLPNHEEWFDIFECWLCPKISKKVKPCVVNF